MTFATPTPHTDSMSQGPHRLVAKWFTMLNPQTRASIVGADATRSTPREGAMGPDSRDTNANNQHERCSHDHPSIDRCVSSLREGTSTSPRRVSLASPPILWVATKRTRLERQRPSPTRATRAAERATRQQRDDETSRQHHHRRIVDR